MTKIYDTWKDLTIAIVDEVDAKLPRDGIFSAEFGLSNVSASAYLDVSFGGEDGITGGFKLRVSDHADRYGSDYTIRIDAHPRICGEEVVTSTEIEEDGEVFIDTWTEFRVTIEDYVFDEMVANGIARILAAKEAQ